MPKISPEKQAYDKVYRSTNKSKIKKRHSKYFQKNKAKLSKYNGNHQLNRYGITDEQFKSLFEQQLGLCAICHQPETVLSNGKPRTLSVDHCHNTGVVRGLLCTRCNQALGLFGDSPDRVRAAALYLEKTANG